MHLQEGTLNHPPAILAIPFGDGDDHAEGITLFSSINGSSSLLVVYDSPRSDRLCGRNGNSRRYIYTSLIKKQVYPCTPVFPSILPDSLGNQS